ncbi:MAG: BrnT family toxin [Bryobacteraceae bacterium]
MSFEGAARVFLDRSRIEQYDDQEDYGEDRWITIGIVGPALLAVVYTVRDEDGEVIRLISARRANAQEKRAYRQHAARSKGSRAADPQAEGGTRGVG